MKKGIVIVALVLSLVMMMSFGVAGEAQNLITNGTFDVSLDSWVGQEAVITLDTAEKYTGASSMKVVKGISYGYPYYVVALEAGKTYDFSCMFKSENGKQVAAGLIVWNEDASDVLAYMDVAVSDEAGSDGWTELKSAPEGFTFAPEGTFLMAWLYFAHLPTGNMTTLWIDDVVMTEHVAAASSTATSEVSTPDDDNPSTGDAGMFTSLFAVGLAAIPVVLVKRKRR